MRTRRWDDVEDLIAEVNLSGAGWPGVAEFVELLHLRKRPGRERRVGTSGELPQSLILRDVFSRSKHDGQRHVLLVAHLAPASDDRIDGRAQRVVDRFGGRAGVDQ